jgi:hypothetical protein
MATTLYPSAEKLGGLSQRALVVGVVGLVATAAGAFMARDAFFRAWLTAFWFWGGLGIGSLGILLLHCVTGGNWGVTIRRLLESGAKTLPLLALCAVPLLFGLPDLFLWARPDVVAHDAILQHKAKYLNVPFHIARTVAFFAIWILTALAVTRMTLAQDKNNDSALARRLRRLCGPLIIVHVMTVSFASFDWIMSLEPHWFSTVFGALSLAGQNLATMSFLTAVIVALAGQKIVADAHVKQSVYDLGNLMLAFTMFWAYLAFSQLLIIWAGNLPEEIPWYLKRTQGGWGVVGMAIIVLHFAVPFLMLINRYVKRNPTSLSRVALLIVVMRLVEVWFSVAPAAETAIPLRFHWLDIAAPVGLGGLWLAAFFHQLKSTWDVPSRNHLSGEGASS